MAELDLIINQEYKGAEIEIIVEDNFITTAKIYMDGECEDVIDVYNDKHPNGLPFQKKFLNPLYKQIKDRIDTILFEDEREYATNMKSLYGR